MQFEVVIYFFVVKQNTWVFRVYGENGVQQEMVTLQLSDQTCTIYPVGKHAQFIPLACPHPLSSYHIAVWFSVQTIYTLNQYPTHSTLLHNSRVWTLPSNV